MPFTVEIRGPLTNKEYKRLILGLKMHGTETYYSDEFDIIFPENPKLHLKKDQLSIKRNNFGATLYLKGGSRGTSELKLSGEAGARLLQMFRFFGLYQRVSISPARKVEYKYKGALFTVKTNCVIGQHYEIKNTLGEKENKEKAKKTLLGIAQLLNLRVWTDKQFKAHKKKSWKNIASLELLDVEKLIAQKTIDSSKLKKRIIDNRKTKKAK